MRQAVNRFNLLFAPTGSPTAPIAAWNCPVGAEIVSVRMPQDDVLVIWAICDLDQTTMETRNFALFGDGQQIITPYKKFIGTFRTDDAANDNHVFEI